MDLLNKMVAIHQPNFFPWLGYFDKIVSSNSFILLDDVQFPKTNGTWLNRVQLMIAGEPRWITAPIKRDYHGTLNINQMYFDEKVPWRQKMLKTIESNYCKADHYKESIDFICNLVSNNENNIAAYNTENIIAIASYILIDIKKIIPSSLLAVDSTATQRIIDLVKLSGGDTYYCGGGAGGYQEDELYKANDIELIYQNYDHPVYEQKGNTEFVKGLSIIDALMNIGKDRTAEMLLCKKIK